MLKSPRIPLPTWWPDGLEPTKTATLECKVLGAGESGVPLEGKPWNPNIRIAIRTSGHIQL